MRNTQPRNPLRLVGMTYIIGGWVPLALALSYPSQLRPVIELLTQLGIVDWIPWLGADAGSLQRALGEDAVRAYVGTKVAAVLIGGPLLAICLCFSIYWAIRFGHTPRFSNPIFGKWKHRVALLVFAALPFMPLVALEADHQLLRPSPEYWRIYVGMFASMTFLLAPAGLLMMCLGPDIGYPDSPPRQREGDDGQGPSLGRAPASR